ncbi:MAG TPA: LEPR-XLL domain-containing protein, partial [Tepidisphaeraceae bacterium]
MSKRSRRLAAGLFPLQVEMLENRLLLSAAATSTALIASDNPSALGEVIALTANVSSSGGSPDGGSVLFMDGSTVIGTVAVDTTT